MLDWELSEADYNALATLPDQQRMVNGAMWLNPKGPYRHVVFAAGLVGLQRLPECSRCAG